MADMTKKGFAFALIFYLAPSPTSPPGFSNSRACVKSVAASTSIIFYTIFLSLLALRSLFY